MDAQKAELAAQLVAERAALLTKVKDLKDTIVAATHGDLQKIGKVEIPIIPHNATTTVQIPVRWLPRLITLATAEIDHIENEIWQL